MAMRTILSVCLCVSGLAAQFVPLASVEYYPNSGGANLSSHQGIWHLSSAAPRLIGGTGMYASTLLPWCTNTGGLVVISTSVHPPGQEYLWWNLSWWLPSFDITLPMTTYGSNNELALAHIQYMNPAWAGFQFYAQAILWTDTYTMLAPHPRTLLGNGLSRCYGLSNGLFLTVGW